MPLMRGNRVTNLLGTERGFNVALNFTDYFEIGALQSTQYFLKGEMVGPDEEFLFNGVLFLPDVGKSGTIIDSFPKGPIPKGWTKEPLVDAEGYKLMHDKTGTIIFGYRTIGNIYQVITNVYDENGMIMAETNGNDFLVRNGPLRLGRRAGWNR